VHHHTPKTFLILPQIPYQCEKLLQIAGKTVTAEDFSVIKYMYVNTANGKNIH